MENSVVMERTKFAGENGSGRGRESARERELCLRNENVNKRQLLWKEHVNVM